MQDSTNVITQFRCEKCSQIIGDTRYQCNTEQENGLVLLSKVSEVLKNQNPTEADLNEVGIYKNLSCVCGLALGWFYLTASIKASDLTEVFVLLNNKIVGEMLVNESSCKDECCSKMSTISENSITSEMQDVEYMSSPPRDTQMPNGDLNKQKWVDDFKKLLHEKNFSGSTTWRVALRALESDPRYARFRTLPERRQLFNQHKTQRAKAELQQRRQREKEARARLERLLLTCGKVDSHTPYVRCEALLGSEPAWRAVLGDRQRRELVHDVRCMLARREREMARSLRRRCVRSLAGVLAQLRLPASATWHEAQAALLQCPRFAGDASLLGAVRARGAARALAVEGPARRARRRPALQRAGAARRRPPRFKSFRFIQILHGRTAKQILQRQESNEKDLGRTGFFHEGAHHVRGVRARGGDGRALGAAGHRQPALGLPVDGPERAPQLLRTAPRNTRPPPLATASARPTHTHATLLQLHIT